MMTLPIFPTNDIQIEGNCRVSPSLRKSPRLEKLPDMVILQTLNTFVCRSEVFTKHENEVSILATLGDVYKNE